MTKSIINATALKEAIVDLESEILTRLGLDTNRYGAKCPCPVHNGDNPSGFSYSLEHRSWKCWTHHCESEYGSDIIGLIMGIQKCSFSDALGWIVKEMNIDPANLNVEQVS